MKLPNGQKVQNRTLNEIVDRIAMGIVGNEVSFSDATEAIWDEIREGYESDVETLEGLDVESTEFLIDHVQDTTMQYAGALTEAKQEVFDRLLKNKEW